MAENTTIQIKKRNKLGMARNLLSHESRVHMVDSLCRFSNTIARLRVEGQSPRKRSGQVSYSLTFSPQGVRTLVTVYQEKENEEDASGFPIAINMPIEV